MLQRITTERERGRKFSVDADLEFLPPPQPTRVPRIILLEPHPDPVLAVHR